MVLHLYCEALHRRIEAWAFRDRPALQHAVRLQSEIVMKTARGMLLNHVESVFLVARAAFVAARLRRAGEMALASILAESHSNDYSRDRHTPSSVKTACTLLVYPDSMTTLVIAWWFLLWTPGGTNGPTVVGPFEHAAGCESVRTWAAQAAQVTSHPVAISPCWSGTLPSPKEPARP